MARCHGLRSGWRRRSARYGLAKKKAPLDPLDGLTLETALLAPLAIVYLVILHRSGDGAFLRTGAASDALMIGGGLVTTVPLLLFAAAVRSVPLSVIGILQYIGPTMQFILGVFVYRRAVLAHAARRLLDRLDRAGHLRRRQPARAARRPSRCRALDEGTA